MVQRHVPALVTGLADAGKLWTDLSTVMKERYSFTYKTNDFANKKSNKCRSNAAE